ncbi:M48 family metallopeptidase [Kordia sp.]|uniref:M48 family metallopeptidase n=1 Tax=Kordia sp. TaxID=1965332 RepID=UPI003D292221
METQTLQYGTSVIEYRVAFADRKTLGIKVHPDKSVAVTAPLDTTQETITQKVNSKAAWILKQQDFFLSFFPLTPPRRYVSGETHLYLGRQYRLKVVVSATESVKLRGGYIEVQTHSKEDVLRIAHLLKLWYHTKALLHIYKLFEKYVPMATAFSNNTPTLKLRWMEKRWGSCAKSGKITLNTELIKAPKKCIEYVVVHELCHLKYHNHSMAFYNLLTEMYPNWQKVKQQLEKFMV